jgi:hypothetical protein
LNGATSGWNSVDVRTIRDIDISNGEGIKDFSGGRFAYSIRQVMVTNEKKDRENKEQASLTRQQVTEAFLLENPIGRAMMQIKAGPGEKNRPSFLGPLTESHLREQAGRLSKSAEIQAAVQLAIKEQARENPLKTKADTNFKTPEGFSNVVGVGANPVMEAMAAQTEIALQQLAELQKLNAKGNDTQTDFTKDSK